VAQLAYVEIPQRDGLYYAIRQVQRGHVCQVHIAVVGDCAALPAWAGLGFLSGGLRQARQRGHVLTM
jgi:hypothetical protein